MSPVDSLQSDLLGTIYSVDTTSRKQAFGTRATGFKTYDLLRIFQIAHFKSRHLVNRALPLFS